MEGSGDARLPRKEERVISVVLEVWCKKAQSPLTEAFARAGG